MLLPGFFLPKISYLRSFPTFRITGMYKTRKILSVAPASSVSTGLSRFALTLLAPLFALPVAMFFGAISSSPLFGVIIAGFTVLYLPLLLLSRKANVSISKNMQVNWTPARRPNQRLLKSSLNYLALLTIFGTVFFLTR